MAVRRAPCHCGRMSATSPTADRTAREPQDWMARSRNSGRNALSGVLFGVGLVAFIDETVFHQLLHWHHFYDLGTPELGLVSDGFFHALDRKSVV